MKERKKKGKERRRNGKGKEREKQDEYPKVHFNSPKITKVQFVSGTELFKRGDHG